MSKLKKQRAKENFLKNVEGVDKTVLIEDINANLNGEDLYTYFMKKDAFSSGFLNTSNLGDFLHKAYSDWYFLHKNTQTKNIKAVKLLSDFNFAPINISIEECLKIISEGIYNDILPIFFQYINEEKDKFFICIKTDELFNKKFNDIKYDVRLYINLKVDKLITFADDFLTKAYNENIPALIKILNNDYRCDTITIYTDYEYAQKIVDTINQIGRENFDIFAEVGNVSTMLGVIDGYIGFGEQPNPQETYFASRCKALSSTQDIAQYELLKSGIIGKENKIIYRNDGSSYTPSEYLTFLIEKNIIKIIENKIEDLEQNNPDDTDQLDKLYALREDIHSGIDVNDEVKKLKRSFTRNNNYTLKLEGIGSDNFDYVSKMYNIFSTEKDRILKIRNEQQKKDIISDKIFVTSENFEGINTREFLDTYFKSKLAEVLTEIINQDTKALNGMRTNEVLINLKQKTCAKLSNILSSIVDDDDEGKEYITRCVNDYVRMLSTDAMENVEVIIDGKTISLDTDVNADIIAMLPALQQDANNLSTNMDFIDNTLMSNDINANNICLHKDTKDITKSRTIEPQEKTERYYYNPDGYLSTPPTEYALR